jgi:hypothetical protein
MWQIKSNMCNMWNAAGSSNGKIRSGILEISGIMLINFFISEMIIDKFLFEISGII